MFASLGWVAVGLVALTVGAEWLVRGASRLALRLGISALVVGLTVVAFGTSAPELVVSVRSAWIGSPELAVGNVVGSNIFNVAVILGLAAVVYPIACHSAIIRREMPLMICTVILLAAMVEPNIWGATRGFSLGPGDGCVLLTMLVLYLLLAWWLARNETPEVQQEFTAGLDSHPSRRVAGVAFDVCLVAAGVALLVVGAQLLVGGAVQLARLAGVSELVIGLTIVAAGTSLPELATSIVAAARKQPDLCVGNVVGSNIFNVLGILGVTSLFGPLPIGADVLYRDLPVAVGVAILAWPLMITGRRISRWEGLLLLVAYGGYLTLVIRQSLPASAG